MRNASYDEARSIIAIRRSRPRFGFLFAFHREMFYRGRSIGYRVGTLTLNHPSDASRIRQERERETLIFRVAPISACTVSDKELAFSSSSFAFPCKESCHGVLFFKLVLPPFDTRRLWHGRRDANERIPRSAGHNQGTGCHTS